MEILNPIWPNNWLDPPGWEQSVVVALFTVGLLATDVTYIPLQINTVDLNIIEEHGLRLMSELTHTNS